MALKASIYKADLQVSDLDRNYYNNHQLTIARHPSESEERMMVRLLAFILHTDQQLTLTKGISTDDEPDIWLHSLSGEIDLWIELGQPDERRIRRACGRARDVYIYPYSGHGAEIWWSQMEHKVSAINNLHVYNLPPAMRDPLTQFADKSMVIQSTIQDGEIWLSGNGQSASLSLQCWKE